MNTLNSTGSVLSNTDTNEVQELFFEGIVGTSNLYCFSIADKTAHPGYDDVHELFSDCGIYIYAVKIPEDSDDFSPYDIEDVKQAVSDGKLERIGIIEGSNAFFGGDFDFDAFYACDAMSAELGGIAFELCKEFPHNFFVIDEIALKKKYNTPKIRDVILLQLPNILHQTLSICTDFFVYPKHSATRHQVRTETLSRMFGEPVEIMLPKHFREHEFKILSDNIYYKEAYIDMPY